MSKSSRKEFNRVQFTKLLIDIQNDIDKLDKLYLKNKIEFEIITSLQEAFNSYVGSNHSLKDYLIFRQRTLSIKYENMSKINRPDTKQIVCNIVLGIVGLGVIYGLAVGINYLLNDKALFFKPEAVNGIDAVIEDIDALKNNVLAATI